MKKKFILGAHGCVWTDRFMRNPILQDMAVMDENRSFKYVDRQSVQYNRYTAAGYHYRVPLPIVEKTLNNDKAYTLTITSPVREMWMSTRIGD